MNKWPPTTEGGIWRSGEVGRTRKRGEKGGETVVHGTYVK